MKKIWIIGFLFLSAFSIYGCSKQQDSQEKTDKISYQKLTPEEAKEMMDTQDDLVVVDVRRQEEYDEKHLEGAVLIPLDTIADEQPEQLPDLDQPILVYCRTGVRSKASAEKLVDIGYTAVYDIGGIVDWPYDTVSEN
ncbi:rhodanese-like domain-containing protein [Diplocloster agilis]|uniref:Rhodanese-like domain-containing protein n=1 Tax=Diplocloster agilis TaxID=2850323 RepID=A0A949NGC7_9FIRM|nr:MULTISPECIES: rhodanese-like domain-containing protein [Lachnospiraceae]MBU9739501.1 rhodanese-like domain-containing protein [Diplocloster agilis]MBU9745217.1 rhodanese-like domain-containing protein [Diplocloster agilis]MCU6736333.1 rhodanese-like domain-containing protein [Suonthocola fibrivorans]SCJ89276.1 Thiosulfate sulfurtransferase PspE precursor [uncultured Clostridium sp.]